MKDQNTPTNTLEEAFAHLDKLSEYNKLLGRGNGDLEDACHVCGISPSGLKAHIKEVVSQAVNKVNEEAEYWRKRAARWKKEVEELNGKLMDIKLNKDETPKGDK